MTLDEYLASLREIAEKATPGPWATASNYGEDVWQLDPPDRLNVPLTRAAREYRAWGRAVDHHEHEANAAHIAAMNPAVALALLDVVEAAERFRMNGTQETERALYAALSRLSSLASKP